MPELEHNPAVEFTKGQTMNETVCKSCGAVGHDTMTCAYGPVAHRPIIVDECAIVDPWESLSGEPQDRPKRQHVSDQAWFQLTMTHAAAAVDAALKQRAEGIDAMQGWAEKFKGDLDVANGKLLDANIRIEVLEHANKSADRTIEGLKEECAKLARLVSHWSSKEDKARAEIERLSMLLPNTLTKSTPDLLITPNLLDPRFGK